MVHNNKVSKEIMEKDKIMIQRIPLSMLIILLLFSTACSLRNSSTSEKLPGIDIPVEEMNTKARLYAPKEANQFKKNGTLVNVVLENLTNTPIDLPPDHGVRLFTKQDNKWIPIQNDLDYSTGDIRVLPKAQMTYGGLIIPTNPVISDSQSFTTMLRIVVIGMLEGSSKQQVAAYIDINLSP